MAKTLMACILVFGCTEASAAGFSWDQSTISLKAAPADQRAEAAFVFTNTSAAPIEVKKVSTSCGCTTAKLAKQVYEPGEKGELKVNFEFSGRKGVQEKSIIVQTGDSGTSVLTFRVEIPDSIAWSPKELVWKAGEAPEAKFFELKILQEGAEIKAARALGNAFRASLDAQEQPGGMRVKVSPLSTERPVRGTVRVEIADPKPRSIFLKVRVE